MADSDDKPNAEQLADVLSDADTPLTEDDAEEMEADAWKEFEAAENGKDADVDDDARAADEAAKEDAEAKDGDGDDDEPPADQDGSDGDQDDDAAPTGDDQAGQQDDIWNAATPEQRAAYEAAQDSEKKAKEDWNRMRGTVSGLTRKVNDLTAQLNAQPAGEKPDGSADATDEANAVFDGEDWKTFEEDYPEVAGPLKAAFGAQEARIQNLTRELGGISTDRRADHIANQVNIVADAHPDYDKIAGSEEFSTWYETAPAFIRAGIERNAQDIVDGDEVTHIVKLFKQETGWGSKEPPGNGHDPNPAQQPADGKRQRQLEAAKQPRSRSPGATPSGIPDDEDGAWKAYESMGL